MVARRIAVLLASIVLASLIALFAPTSKRIAKLPVKPAVAQDSTPRRPPPEEDAGEVYDVARKAETVDSQGTAFALDRRGVWATAGHATLGCARVTLGSGGRESAPMQLVLQGMDSDASLIIGNEGARAGLPLEEHTLPPGSIGYHMGFPSGRPVLIASRLIGAARARSQHGASEKLLVWSEEWRKPESDIALSGLSGGPVISANGRVAGLVSLVTNRRGRIFTVPPESLQRLATRIAATPDHTPATAAISGPDDAVARFNRYMSEGLIRYAYCTV